MQPTIYGITHDDVTESEIMELIRNPKLYFLISNCRGGQLPGEVFQFINTPPPPTVCNLSTKFTNSGQICKILYIHIFFKTSVAERNTCKTVL